MFITSEQKLGTSLENVAIETDVSVSNGVGSDVIITTPADFEDAPSGAGDATTPSTELEAYYDQAPWNVFLTSRTIYSYFYQTW